MPIHIQPVIRAKEIAEEDAGLINVINSDGITAQRNEEKAGIVPVNIPVGTPHLFNGRSYDSNAISNKTKW